MGSRSDELVFFVNGRKICLENVDPQLTLASFLRRKLRLTGTKQSCNDGSCGACTVMVSSYDRGQGKIRHNAVTACMVPICSLHHRAVTTIEGIGDVRSGLHPVQERLVKFHGTQCGFCSPGMVMTMCTLLRNNPHPTTQQVIDSLHGNICRCTGYRPIIDAFSTFTKDKNSCQQVQADRSCCQRATDGSCCQRATDGSCCQRATDGSCCQRATDESCCQRASDECCHTRSDTLTDVSSLMSYDPTQEPIFPPELQVYESLHQTLKCFKGPNITWYRPVTLEQALKIKSENPTARVSSGSTSLVQELKTTMADTVVIDVSDLTELKGHSVQDDTFYLGSGLSMADVVSLAQKDQYKNVKVLQAIPEVLESWGTQVKTSATIGGHIMLRQPKYDLVPLLVASRCAVKIAYLGGTRVISLDEAFFTGTSPIRPSEIVVSLLIPCYKKEELLVRTFKVAKRKHQSLASLIAAIIFEMSPTVQLRIDKARIVLGGDVPKLFCPRNTEEFLSSRTVTESLIDEVNQVLESELLPPDLSGFSQTQVTWARGFLSKCLRDMIAESKESNQELQLNPGFKSSQLFEINREGSFSRLNIVGQPVPHSTGVEQATGEAVFIDDMSPNADELFVYPVLSSRAYARIVGIDMSQALALPGVHGYIDHKDIPGVNLVYPVSKDEELLATDTVHHVGQMICGIVAENRETAMMAAKCVEVSYEDLHPAILSLREAIAAKSFMGVPRVLQRGDIEAGFQQSDHVLEGEVETKGQKHIYLEMLSSLAVPKERHEMEIFSNTQMPHYMQITASEVLDIDANNITLRVKRIGGGYGGKEVRCSLTTTLSALAANKFRRPVRCILECMDDTTMNGGRHPFLAKYKVGFTAEGRILSLEVKLFVDGGASVETTQRILEVAVIVGSTCYSVPAIRMEGQGCRTNLSSNGAFRGFGHPQADFIMENIILHVSSHLSMQPEKVREMHLMQTGEVTLGNMIIEQPTLRRCWDECKALADFDQRVELVNEFNRANLLQKRGIAIQPVMFGIGFYAKYANQGGALVHVYTDGSVRVTHGGCEMGQGLHTKIKQIASEALGLSFDKILVGETSTQLVPNAFVTAASVNTDLNGRAVHNACLTLRERLQPFRESDPDGGWLRWVKAAYRDRVSLSATGFAKVGNCDFNFEKGTGTDSLYFTYGAGCSEVEVDCLTGEHKLIRTDMVMDVGRSINPAIDIGQIEGGFVQGYGYYMMEDVVRSKDGQLLTNSPMSYKVPLASDLPSEFNVALLKTCNNENGIHSSKGIGEPPFVLSLSTYLAAHKAVEAYRLEQVGGSGLFKLEHPATPANIIKACKGF